MQLLSSLPIFALIGILAAAPTTNSIQQRSVEQNAQSCTATNWGIFNHYKIEIGTPYDKKLCDTSTDELYNNRIEEIASLYKCRSVGDNSTQLKFNYLFYRGGNINKALGHAFPSVNGFNCPDY